MIAELVDEMLRIAAGRTMFSAEEVIDFCLDLRNRTQVIMTTPSREDDVNV